MGNWHAVVQELEEERDEALNQLSSARHSITVLESRAAQLENERDQAEAQMALANDSYSKQHDAYHDALDALTRVTAHRDDQ
jgi:chromosome segregation ATPase